MATARIRIVHAGANFAALGKVAYSLPNVGMGIAFTEIDPHYQLVLGKRTGQLRDARKEQANR